MPALICTGCKKHLPQVRSPGAYQERCSLCGGKHEIEIFPAYGRGLAATESAEERMLVDGQSSCFQHPRAKATRTCDACGRFMCSLCDVELGARHLCPACVASGKEKGKLEGVETEGFRHDHVALWLAVAPLLLTFPFFFFHIITGPATLYVVFRYWKVPQGVVKRSKALFIVALIGGLAQLGVFGFFVAAVIRGD